MNKNGRSPREGAADSLPSCSLRWDYPDQVRGVPGRTRFSGILPPRRTREVYTWGLSWGDAHRRDLHVDPGRGRLRGHALGGRAPAGLLGRVRVVRHEVLV